MKKLLLNFWRKYSVKKNTLKSVKISSKKGETDTDIDVLCLLGNKALCVQVKSQKLTELARKGSDEALNNDFQKAVQDAYQQGLIARSKILSRNSKFRDSNNREVRLSEEIDEAYLMVITTENYPSLTHQAHVMLSKNAEDPFPIAITIFDLELIVHYLSNPYDFLYYIRQRTNLMDHFKADEEIVFLGFHLKYKLWRNDAKDFEGLDTSFGQLVDRNYYPFKAGIAVSNEGDTLISKWKNEKFQKLIDQLKLARETGFTDAVFYLYDLAGEGADELVNFIERTKEKAQKDGQQHDFSLIFENGKSGITFLASPDSAENLEQRLMPLALARKYKTKADTWLALGASVGSPNFVDAVGFNKQPWKEDSELDELANVFLKPGLEVPLEGKRIGRNNPCPCSSGKKFKKCHGF